MPKGPSTRQRSFDDLISFPPWEEWKPKLQVWEKTQSPLHFGSKTFKGGQKTVSEGHRKSRDGSYREGGPFLTERYDLSIGTRVVSAKRGNYRYNGPVFTNPEGLIYKDGLPDISGTLTPASDSTLDKLGATAISIIDPTNSNAATGQAIGEIFRDGVPIPGIQGWQRRASVAKAAGSEFLNAVFGWLPLVSDITDTADSIKQRNVILKGYRDNAGGKGTYREFEFDDVVSTKSDTIVGRWAYGFQPDPLPNGTESATTLTRTYESKTERYFVGRFTYASPDRDDRIGNMLGVDSEVDKLFGLSLTPDLLWELAPWSWAVDWFSNAGDVIHNLTSFKLGGLVMRYGYIMETTTSKVTWSLPSTGLPGVAGSMPPTTLTKVVKKRRPANPFGFGLTWEGLSPTQLAITAALGITRL